MAHVDGSTVYKYLDLLYRNTPLTIMDREASIKHNYRVVDMVLKFDSSCRIIKMIMGEKEIFEFICEYAEVYIVTEGEVCSATYHRGDEKSLMEYIAFLQILYPHIFDGSLNKTILRKVKRKS